MACDIHYLVCNSLFSWIEVAILKVEVKAISPQGSGNMPDRNNVLLVFEESGEERWMALGDHVDMKFVKKGKAFIKVENEEVVYIKMDFVSGEKKVFNNRPYSGFKPQESSFKPASNYSNPEKDRDIRAQMLTKAAINLIATHNDYVKNTEMEQEAFVKPTRENIVMVANEIQLAVEEIKRRLGANTDEKRIV